MAKYVLIGIVAFFATIVIGAVSNDYRLVEIAKINAKCSEANK